jgi:hypothetical protein
LNAQSNVITACHASTVINIGNAANLLQTVSSKRGVLSKVWRSTGVLTGSIGLPKASRL